MFVDSVIERRFVQLFSAHNPTDETESGNDSCESDVQSLKQLSDTVCTECGTETSDNFAHFAKVSASKPVKWEGIVIHDSDVQLVKHFRPSFVSELGKMIDGSE